MYLTSEIATLLEEIGEIALAAASGTKASKQPQPRQSSSMVISVWMGQVWQRNEELTSRSFNGGCWAAAHSAAVLLGTWNGDRWKPVCLDVKCLSGLHVARARGSCPWDAAKLQKQGNWLCTACFRGLGVSEVLLHSSTRCSGANLLLKFPVRMEPFGALRKMFGSPLRRQTVSWKAMKY